MTFRDNARIKAEAASKATGLPAFADDSGWWWMGSMARPVSIPRVGPANKISPRHGNDRRKAARTRCHGAGRSPRPFRSALCVAWPDSHLEEFEARVDGTLVRPPRGDQGFGYDPCFSRTATRAHSADAQRRETRPAAAGRACRTGLAPSSSLRRRALPDDEQTAFGVYVHWPFCLSKCPYCDSTAMCGASQSMRLASSSFTAEIASTAARVPGRTVSTIFSVVVRRR